MKKIIVIYLFTFVLMFMFVGVSATDGMVITPTYVPFEGYEYRQTSKTTGKSIDWTHEHTNPNEFMSEEVTMTVSRVIFASIKGTVKAEIKTAVVAKAEIGTELEFGKQDEESWSVKWVIEPGVTKLLRSGSKTVQTRGYEDYYYNGMLESSTLVTSHYSYESFTDSIIIN